MTLLVVCSKGTIIRKDLKLNQSSFLVSLLLALFLTQVTEVVLLLVMLVERVGIVEGHVRAELTLFVILFLVFLQSAPLIELLLEEKHRFFLHTQVTMVEMVCFVVVILQGLK